MFWNSGWHIFGNTAACLFCLIFSVLVHNAKTAADIVTTLLEAHTYQEIYNLLHMISMMYFH